MAEWLEGDEERVANELRRYAQGSCLGEIQSLKGGTL
jgi:hypothetical protein